VAHSPDHSDRPSDAPTPAAASRTVLLVEDETAVRTVARRILERSGFRVLEGINGADGLQVWARHAPEIEALVTDVVMPGMGGPALAENILQERPQLPVVFMSGYTDGALDGVDISGRRVYFLAKPFSPAELLTRVTEALEG
jgi:two-component system, cell cycle sensor histidine kinase and response regulator CckA